jgi:hypothetical protein
VAVIVERADDEIAQCIVVLGDKDSRHLSI